MKMIHLSDLHLGKWVNGFSMIEDQQYILQQILEVIQEEKPQAVILAGDIYDKSIPPAEAVQLFDDFLVRLAEEDIHVMIISGNHDSPKRLAFGGRLMRARKVHVSPVYDGRVEPVTLEDDYGRVNFYLLPFLKPAHLRAVFPESRAESYTETLKEAIDHMKIPPQERNVLVTHQFVTGASRCESEDISVGGTDNVDASVFQDFDYVALGHLHSPQNVAAGKDQTIRYCGTPLKYSFSEVNHEKSLTVVRLDEKGDLQQEAIPLKPKRDLRELQGSYMELTNRAFYQDQNTDDYLHITLTDEADIFDAIGKLRTVYPNLMKLDYDNQRTRASGIDTEIGTDTGRPPAELFADFYMQQNGQSLSEPQQQRIFQLIQEIWEEEA